MQQIHSLIMSLSFTGVEIKTAHSLESWSGGVLVMVSGSLQIRNMGARRKFMQTLFLAPQEKGFFVLNDIFHFVDEEPVHRHATVLLAQNNTDSKLNASNNISEPGIIFYLRARICHYCLTYYNYNSTIKWRKERQ